MAIFEHSFTLIGLVLGLALVEVLSGFARMIRTRDTVHIGWLTPLLAIFVIGDVTTFWGMLWELREQITSVWRTLGLGVLLSGIYYVAASLVLPDRLEECIDFDAHFMRRKRLVLGLIFFCVASVMAIGLALGRVWSPVVMFINTSYLGALAFTTLAPWRWANLAGLGTLIVILILAFAL